jgi:hypothetical protein
MKLQVSNWPAQEVVLMIIGGVFIYGAPTRFLYIAS